MPYKHKKDRLTQAKQWRKSHREYLRIASAKRRRKQGIIEKEKYLKEITLPLSEWRCSYSDPKVRANKLLWRAVRKKRIQKPTECSICHKYTPSYELHGHHKDYSKWQEVIWVCRKCHFTKQHTNWGKKGAKIAGGKEAQAKRMKSLIRNGTLGNNQFKSQA